MMTTQQYLDAVKARLNIQSDYALAKSLGVTRAAISKLRIRGDVMGDSTAIKVAEILNIDPAQVIIAAHAERSKKPTERAIWEGMLEKLGGIAALLLIGIGGVTAPPPAQAAAPIPSQVLDIM